MADEFFSDEQNQADLISHMPEEDRARFAKYGHFRIEGVFVDRVFIVYKPTGLTPSGAHKEPEVLTTIKVRDFSVDPREGCQAVLHDEKFDQEMTIRHVPRRLFGYPVYISVPARLSLRWDARLVQGHVWRSLSFALLVKTRNKSSFYSKGNVYCETPNAFLRLYPAANGKLQF